MFSNCVAANLKNVISFNILPYFKHFYTNCDFIFDIVETFVINHPYLSFLRLRECYFIKFFIDFLNLC